MLKGELVKERFVIFAEENIARLKDNFGKITADIELKEKHGIIMADELKKATLASGLFDESYGESASVDGALHDVGRFEAYMLAGNLKDSDLKAKTGYNDHGALGKILLLADNKRLLRYFLEDCEYDGILTEVVGNHTNIHEPAYNIKLEDLVGCFNEYGLDEVLKDNNSEMKTKLIALKIKLLQEVDSLELLYNVAKENWKPAIGLEDKYYIKDEVWKLFTGFEEINMIDLKNRGLWTCNAGFLLRYSLLLRKINMVATLKGFRDGDTFDRILDATLKYATYDNGDFGELNDKLIFKAQEFIKIAVDNLIEYSDGNIITNDVRNAAKQKTLSMFDL